MNYTARGVAHDVATPVRGLFATLMRQPYLIIVLLMVMGGVGRGCMCSSPPPPDLYEPTPDESSRPVPDSERAP